MSLLDGLPVLEDVDNLITYKNMFHNVTEFIMDLLLSNKDLLDFEEKPCKNDNYFFRLATLLFNIFLCNQWPICK